MALLVFAYWLVCRQKPNVPFAGRLSFYTDAQRLRLVAVRVIETRPPGAGLEGKQNFEFIKWLRKLGEAFAATGQCRLSSCQPTTEDP